MAKVHELTIDVDGEKWDRIGIKTHLIQLLEPLREGFEKVVALIIARAQFDVHLANGDYDLLPFDGRGEG